MQIKPNEISSLIKEQLKNFDNQKIIDDFVTKINDNKEE